MQFAAELIITGIVCVFVCAFFYIFGYDKGRTAGITLAWKRIEEKLEKRGLSIHG